jgi:Domain of unknown function (DUF4440)
MRVPILPQMILLMLTTTPLLAQQPMSDPAASALASAREAVWRAWFAGDTIALSKLVPSVVAAGSGHQPWESRAITFQGARAFASSGARLVDLRFDSTTIALDGNLAIVRSRFAYTIESPNHERNTVTGRATEIFVLENERWLNPFWYLQ